jgi:hypothetical protein
MTTKEIAKAVNKTERSIQSWAKKTGEKIASIGEKIASVQKTGKPADYNLEETCAIIETGLGRNAADLFRMSATPQPVAPQPDIAAIVRETMTAMVPALIAIVRGALPEQKALALPAVPEMAPRDSLRRIVAKYSRQSGDFPGAWNNLYSEFSYRYHVNLKERAKNRGMEILDYAEADGFIEDLLALAVNLYGAAA